MRVQVQQLESKLSTAQLAVRQSSAKSPSKSQHFTASLSSLDAASPSQAAQPSQSSHAAKKPRGDSGPALPSQGNAASQGFGASDGTGHASTPPDMQLPGGSHQNDASQSGIIDNMCWPGKHVLCIPSLVYIVSMIFYI